VDEDRIVRRPHAHIAADIDPLYKICAFRTFLWTLNFQWLIVYEIYVRNKDAANGAFGRLR
jgi:hypothetical protein